MAQGASGPNSASPGEESARDPVPSRPARGARNEARPWPLRLSSMFLSRPRLVARDLPGTRNYGRLRFGAPMPDKNRWRSHRRPGGPAAPNPHTCTRNDETAAVNVASDWDKPSQRGDSRSDAPRAGGLILSVGAQFVRRAQN